MTIDTLERSEISKTKTSGKNLVARWLVDENSRLYCQWVLEDLEGKANRTTQ
jgi:hypothetical protein